MAVDWLKIKNDYINGGGSYRKLADKYGVSFASLKDVAIKEQWAKIKEEHTNKIRTKTEQKTAEKISDALSEEAASKVRIRAQLLKMAENWVTAQGEKIHDVADYRRIVQSCVDLGVMDVQETEENDGDGLLEALAANAEQLFEDGDDSAMLPDEEDSE